jgi:hypothetical protein
MWNIEVDLWGLLNAKEKHLSFTGMVEWVVEQRQPLKGSSAANIEFMPTHLASVFSALLF